MRKYLWLSCVVVAMVALAAFPALAQDTTAPEQVVVQQAGMFPEGIEWDAEAGQFLLGSLGDGGVYRIDDDGTINPFIPGRDGLSSVGLHIDTFGSRLLVDYSNPAVFSDQEASGTAAVGIYDLDSGDELGFYDLSALYEGRHFANDLTADDQGNVYVTDSFSPVIYKVTPEGETSVFIQDERLGSEGFGLNGIDFHPNGYLLASENGSATLYKIPMDDPAAMSAVMVSEAFGADGMFLTPEGNLIAVATVMGADGSTTSEIISVSSADDWATATIDQRYPTEGATTVTVRDGEVYAIYPQLDMMGTEPPPDTFEINRVTFEAM